MHGCSSGSTASGVAADAAAAVHFAHAILEDLEQVEQRRRAAEGGGRREEEEEHGTHQSAACGINAHLPEAEQRGLHYTSRCSNPAKVAKPFQARAGVSIGPRPENNMCDMI